MNIHCIENFSTVHDFWATYTCPEKNRVALKFFTVVNILLTFRIFNNFNLPWKQSFPGIFHCIEIFFIIQDFWAQALALKKRVAQQFFTVLNILFTFRSFEQLAFVLKNRAALEFFTVLKYFLSFRIFEQLALALKECVALKIFIVWNTLFTFRIFEQLVLAL